MNKCVHATGTVLYTCADYCITRCDWGCDGYFIDVKITDTLTKSISAKELINVLVLLEDLGLKLELAK